MKNTLESVKGALRCVRIAVCVVLTFQVLGASLEKLRQDAEAGDPKPQVDIGFAYHEGEGVPKDAAEAVEWWRKAADQGNVEAQGNLGAAYANGDGVAKDIVEAHKWFSLAARGGNAAAEAAQNEIALEMTPAQIVQALRLAREFKLQRAAPTSLYRSKHLFD